MKTNIQRKTSELNQYGLENIEALKKLAGEVEAVGFADTELFENGSGDFMLILTQEGKRYQVRRDYSKNVHVSEFPYARFDNVSSHQRGEIYKKHNTGNMKVITAKKLLAQIARVNAYISDMQALEDKSNSKVAEFIDSLNVLKQNGVPYTLSADGKSGYIERGGMEFSFEISQDGYISKKIKISYTVDTTLANFMKLSDNQI